MESVEVDCRTETLAPGARKAPIAELRTGEEILESPRTDALL